MRSLPVVLLALCAALPADLSAQEGPSPAIATALSVGATLAGIGLVPVAARLEPADGGAVIAATAGALILAGPSAGFFYAGEHGRGLKSVLLRLGCGAVGAAGYTLLWNGLEPLDSRANGTSGVGAVLLLVSGALTLGSILVDLSSADDAARRTRAELGVETTPAGAGVGVRIRF